MAKLSRALNINVGVLGHVDSGKTSLVAALSTKLSTAALDKHPQSKERGITLDLGFSAFSVPAPANLQHAYDEVQFTLVDCPGHASLIRTIIGGAQIIDMIILVIDIMKGIQAQTAECLVVGEIATQDLIVVLNKTDLLAEDGRAKGIARARKRLAATFNHTKFQGCPMVPVSAKPGGGEGAGPGALGVDTVTEELLKHIPTGPRQTTGPFMFAIDHCFAIRGQGTVMTGTVMQGGVKVNDTIELPNLKLQRKVKSMQMFKQPVQQCQAGDRVGICVTQLDAKAIERGLACSPGTVPTFSGAIAAVEKIRFHAGRVPSKSRVHVTVGHHTLVADVQVFGVPDEEGLDPQQALQAMIKRTGQLAVKDEAVAFDFKRDYVYQEELYGLQGRPSASSSGADSANGSAAAHFGPQWVLLKFAQSVTAPKDALVIGSRFDADMNAPTCRLAFYGRLVALLDPGDPAALQQLKVYKLKQRAGVIERVAPDGTSAVCKGMFKKETDINLFAGMQVKSAAGQMGTIQGSFGKSGKFKVSFPGGVAEPAAGASNAITLVFKKYIFDQNKRHMAQ